MKPDDPEYWEKLLADEGMAPINTELPSSGRGTMYNPDWNEFSTCDMTGHPQSISKNARKVGRRFDTYQRNWATRAYTGQQGITRDTTIMRLLIWALDTHQDLELVDMLLWRYYNLTHTQFTDLTGRSRKYLEKWRSDIEDMIADYTATEQYPVSEYSITAALREWL